MNPGMIMIRADATPEIGAGHVMRCVALAQAWHDAGGEAEFVMAECAPSILEYLQAQGFAAHLVPNSRGSEADAIETVELARSRQARWIVCDGYVFGSEYRLRIKNSGLRLMCIEDSMRPSGYHADLILNQNLHAREFHCVAGAAGPKFLLGPQFALLRRQFNSWRGWMREVSAFANRILVIMGGSDPCNMIPVVLRSLELIHDLRLEIRVAVSGSNPRISELEAVTSRFHELRLEVDGDVPKLVAWADIAIAAAGSTCWEMCMLGLPALLMDVAENQQAIAEALGRRAISVYLGNAGTVTPEVIADRARQLLQSQQCRELMSQRARALVDGYGAQRVVAELQSA